jgi:hypothetical protein
MKIELTMDLARTLLVVQDAMTENEVELDWAIEPVWRELQKIALHKVNEDFALPTDFDVKGTETYRFQSEIPNSVDIPRKV